MPWSRRMRDQHTDRLVQWLGGSCSRHPMSVLPRVGSFRQKLRACVGRNAVHARCIATTSALPGEGSRPKPEAGS